MNKYFNRYEYFLEDGEFKIVPGIQIPPKSTDKFMVYKKGKDRLDKASQEFYNTPLFGWLILLANPSTGALEFEKPSVTKRIAKQKAIRKEKLQNFFDKNK